MIINLLIATIDDGINRVKDLLLEPRSYIRYIVSHQVTDHSFCNLPPELSRDDVIVSQLEGRGIACNRNNALNLADDDIALLGDDDGRYEPEYFKVVQNAFLEDTAMDVACFKIATAEGEPEYKDYSSESYMLNRESRHYISSLEIAFRIKPVKKNKIWFDERFGLGSELITSGEEAVFIHDCIKKGLKVKFIPEYVVKHSAASATRSHLEHGQERTIFKGAYDARRFSWLALPAAVIDAFKLRSRLHEEGINSNDYLRNRLDGALYILVKRRI